jgi:hypothetical protein
MRYKIIESFDPYAGDALTNKVNEHIAEGWQPVGQATVAYDHNKQTVKMYQTMIKED